MAPEWVLATCSYARWRPEHGVPVQTSIGAPKWWQGPALMDLRSAAPWGRLFTITDPAEFRTTYRACLHRRQHVIRRDLAELRDSYGRAADPDVLRAPPRRLPPR